MQPLATLDPPRQRSLAEPAASGPAPRRHAWDVPAVTPTAAPSFAHSGLLAMLGGHPVFPGWPNVSPAGPDWFLPDSRAFFPMLGMLGMQGGMHPRIPNMPNGTGKHALYTAQVPLHAGAQRKRSHAEVTHAKAGAATDAAAAGVPAQLPLEQQSTHPTAKGTRPGPRPEAPTAAPLPMGSHSGNEPSADSNSRVRAAFAECIGRHIQIGIWIPHEFTARAKCLFYSCLLFACLSMRAAQADQEDATGSAGCASRDVDAQGAPGLSGVSTRLKADSRFITQVISERCSACCTC